MKSSFYQQQKKKNVASLVTGYKERRSSDKRDTSSEKRSGGGGGGGGRRSSSATDDGQDVSYHGPEKVRVRQHGKSCKELSGCTRARRFKLTMGPFGVLSLVWMGSILLMLVRIVISMFGRSRSRRGKGICCQRERFLCIWNKDVLF